MAMDRIPGVETRQGTFSTTGPIQALKKTPKKRKSLQKVQNIAQVKIDYKRRRWKNNDSTQSNTRAGARRYDTST